MIEINPVPEDIQDTLLEESICQALPLNRTLVLPGDREACHKMRRGKLGIYVRKAINDSMCYENHQLFYRDAGS